MIAAPWYLFSLGISLFVVAKILKMVEESKRGERIQVDPNMSDAEIARRLKGSSALSIVGIFALTGLLCVFISLAVHCVGGRATAAHPTAERRLTRELVAGRNTRRTLELRRLAHWGILLGAGGVSNGWPL